MITIRSSKAASDVALICLEADLTMTSGVYTISSDGPMIDSGVSPADGLFGSISWPRSSFRLADGLLLEQQMFLPHDESAVAVCWTLRGDPFNSAKLAVRPFFSGCSQRSYRDVGFRVDSEENGGRLAWLPNVRGPRVIADTNGRYTDEPARSVDCLCQQARASASSEDLITPGSFEFQLSSRPSVLIFSMEADAQTQRNQLVGTFLAGLMQTEHSSRPDFVSGRRIDLESAQRAAA